MEYLIQTVQELESYLSGESNTMFLHVFSSNSTYHPKISKKVAIYLHKHGENTGRILSINHPDAVPVPYHNVLSELNRIGEFYVLNKKYHRYFLPDSLNLLDVNLFRLIKEYKEVGSISEFESQRFYDPNLPVLNCVIPLVKLYEQGKKIYEGCSKYMDWEVDDSFMFYNDRLTEIFYTIEKTGLKVDVERYDKMFNPSYHPLNSEDNVVYTSYNLYNITSRPTNSFNSVNFMAIPHKEEERSTFIPQNSFFLEIDFDGYHLRLLADLLGVVFKGEKAHLELAYQLFSKESITEQEYKYAKQVNFQALYGKVPKKYNHLEFYVKVQEYMDNIWNTYLKEGSVRCPISQRPFTPLLADMNKEKLFNYIVQNLETSRNVEILEKILKRLSSCSTKVALYTYDSILFDFDSSDGKQLLVDLVNIAEEGGKYPISLKRGQDLNF